MQYLRRCHKTPRSKSSFQYAKKVGAAEDSTPKVEPLGEYLEKVRKLRGLTMAALAKPANVNISTIVRMQSGTTGVKRPRGAVQQRLAMALQIPVEYLQEATQKDPFSMPLTNRACPCCWAPDLRWTQIDAKFCMRCGQGLTDTFVECYC